MIAEDWIRKIDVMMFAVLLKLFAIVVAPRAKDSFVELR